MARIYELFMYCTNWRAERASEVLFPTIAILIGTPNEHIYAHPLWTHAHPAWTLGTGRYYAAESMLVLNPETDQYDGSMTPGYGKDTLEGFFKKCVTEGMDGQELGDAAVFGQK